MLLCHRYVVKTRVNILAKIPYFPSLLYSFISFLVSGEKTIVVELLCGLLEGACFLWTLLTHSCLRMLRGVAK